MHSCQRGATLVELLVAITLVGMVFAIAVTLFVFGQRTFALTLAQADLHLTDCGLRKHCLKGAQCC